MARLVRAEPRQLRTRDYVLAARRGTPLADRRPPSPPERRGADLVEASLAAAAAIASEAAPLLPRLRPAAADRQLENMVADGLKCSPAAGG
ncbi:MAG: hypothetical protein R2862_10970 [Thermoanaerobaculia bacterium]